VSRYRVYVIPAAWKEIKDLPGNMRQRVRRAVSELAEQPRPSTSQPLAVPGLDLWEVRRIRLDRWRIVYAVSDSERTVDVLAVRKRPPYDYGDLAGLIEDYPQAPKQG